MKTFFFIKKRIVPFVLVTVLMFIFTFNLLPTSADAGFVSAIQAADALSQLNLFKGDDSGYALDRSITKQESVTMLARMLGLETAALNDSGEGCPFWDVDSWAKGYVSQAYARSLVLGIGNGKLGAANSASAQDYLTFILRALGYSESSDFTWTAAVAFADEIGLTHGEYSDPAYAFLREDAVLISYAALVTPMKGSTQKLISHLIDVGAISSEALINTPLSGYANSGKPIYTAAEIYERTSAATFYVETFSDEADLANDKPSGSASGFFVSQDGLAITCYHVIETVPYIRITTTDGQIYNDIKVVYYDGYRDIAVLRIDKTATDGQTIRSFPYIDLGNSDAIANGEMIYTMSSPSGLQDCISDGIISSKKRAPDDPDYPHIQFTAPISPGSSGGALVNKYGEVIGVLKGAFTSGNDLNLAVPTNSLVGLDLTGEGTTVSEVCAYDIEQNLKSTLVVSETLVTIDVDDTATVVVTRDSPGSVALLFTVENEGIVSCQWGSFTTKTTVPVNITGLAKGRTTVTVTYFGDSGNPDAQAVISVVVN